MFQSVGAAAFFAAWRGLCSTQPNSPFQLPHYRDAFQKLPPELLPHLAIVEEASADQFIIRFMGTWRVELWGADLTGTDPLAVMPSALASSALRNMMTMLGHPCGMTYVSMYITPSGREVTIENIALPIANDPGLPRRMINYVEELATTGYTEPLGTVRATDQRVWLDLGMGVPKKSPVK